MGGDQQVDSWRAWAATLAVGFLIFLGSIITGHFYWRLTPLVLAIVVGSALLSRRLHRSGQALSVPIPDCCGEPVEGRPIAVPKVERKSGA